MKLLDFLNDEYNNTNTLNSQWISLNNDSLVFSDNKIDNNSITKENFFLIIKNNNELLIKYFGIQDNAILSKMVSYNFTQKQIIPLTLLDSLYDDNKKILFFSNITDIINDFDILCDRYTIFLEQPWNLNSKAILSYYDIETNNYPINNDNYSYFLEISFIKDELLDLYRNELNHINMLSNENLAKLLFYYAKNDSHMNINTLKK